MTIQELEAEIRAYEERYGLPSAEVDAAIDDGRLEETFEVCSWLISYRLWCDLKAKDGAMVYNIYDAVYDDDEEAPVAMADDKETQKDCPNCPLYRGGSNTACSRTGKTIRLEEALPLICKSKVTSKPI